jgi:hypothetical protein
LPRAAAFAPTLLPCTEPVSEPNTDPATEPNTDVELEELELTETAAHEAAPCAFSACTSIKWSLPLVMQSAALCGWLLPGPNSMADAPAPFCSAICPAVLPLP